MITLAEVFEALNYQNTENASQVISEAAIDSRQVIPSSMFVALKGERVDGHNYIKQAFDKGARFAIIDERITDDIQTIDLSSQSPSTLIRIPSDPFCVKTSNSLEALQSIAKLWRSKLDIRAIGITGSIGKSTTKELTFEVLSQKFLTIKNEGNLNNEIGLPLTMLRIGKGHQKAVLEMGFYLPGEIRFLCDIARPEIGVVTNVGAVHAARAGSKEAIAKGKAELIESLPANGTAILNFDDPLVKNMSQLSKANILFYGLSPEADLWADNINSLGLDGISFKMHYQGSEYDLSIPVVGKHAVYTALRASAVALTEGMSWEEIQMGLQHGRNQLRLVAVKTESGAMLLDDSYNSSPESAVAALNMLSELKGKKIAILGDMLELGDYEKEGHIRVGKHVAEICDEFFAVGQRSLMMADTAIVSGLAPEKVHWFTDVPELIETLLEYLGEGDVALVKGSLGMGMARIITALEGKKHE